MHFDNQSTLYFSGCTTKMVASKCPSLNTSSNGPVPKTKSPKPKSSNKILSEGSFGPGSPSSSSGVNGGKSEEKWVDGPKKYRQLQNHLHNQAPSSPKKNKGETWIDGPAARVNHQASNFPSPKKSVNTHSHHQKEKVSNGLSGDPCCMTSTKAEMIQKWICNQTHSPTFFGDISQLDDTFFGGHNNGSVFSGCAPSPSNLNHQATNGHNKNSGNVPYFLNQGDQHFNSFYPEPEYKALTVFKTCEDEEEEERPEEEISGEGYEFEFIEVVEPEVPVPTNDVCLQVRIRRGKFFKLKVLILVILR
jgi:hypothetical protein